MTPILQGLAQGYSGDQILKYMARAFPKIAPHIAKATASGYTVDQVIKYINRLMEEEVTPRGLSSHEIEARNQKKYNELGKKILGTASTAAGVTAFARNIPNIIKSGLSQVGPSPMANAPVQPSSVNAPSTPATPPLSPEAQERKQSFENPLINDPQFKEYVKQRMSEGTESTPEKMFREYQSQLASQKKQPPLMSSIATDVEKMQQKEPVPAPVLEEIVEEKPVTLPATKFNILSPEDWKKRSSGEKTEEKKLGKFKNIHTNEEVEVKESPKADQYELIRENKSNLLFPKKAFNAHFVPVEEKKEPESYSEWLAHKEKTNWEKEGKPEKGSIVATPDGEVGEIKDIRQTEGLVDEDGKLHKVKLSDIQMPDEKIQQTVARLLEIPEIDKSSIINYWAYDPTDKELFLMFHNGETYKYSDVPEELESELAEAGVSPKTKGENEFGAWAQDDPTSRGATFINKLISHPKYKRSTKGAEPNPHYRKLRKGYDYWTKLRK